MYKSYLIISLIIVVAGCAPSRYIVPLQEQQKAVTLSLGGPLVKNFGGAIPLPLTSVAGGYGVKEDVTLYGGIHTTSLLFKTIQLEVGGLKNWVDNEGYIPGISTSLTGNFLIGMREGEFRFWPQLDLNAYWLYGKNQSFFYTGLGNWFELSSARAHDEPNPRRWLPNIFIGNTFSRPRTNYTLEVKYLIPGAESDKTVVEYVGIGNKGAVGVYFSITMKL